MTLEEALKIIRSVCEQATVNYAGHQQIQAALNAVEDKCKS